MALADTMTPMALADMMTASDPSASVTLARLWSPDQRLLIGTTAADSDAGFTPAALGRYEIAGQIGRGGMGVVYKAHDTALDRTVAIKVRRSFGGNDDRSLDRFLREARLIARLGHPSLVPILDVGQCHDLIYYVTPFIEGRSLDRLLNESGSLPGREAARIMIEIAEVVGYAHERNVIHRDIKPSNIMLTAEGRPMLLDFGLARATEIEATQTWEGQFLGTPAYVSPEQVTDPRVLDARSDIYSLGATLYALLTGRPPFQGSAMEILRKLIYEEPRPPRDLNSTIDRDLEAICLKALAKHPAQRYATAHALADDLRRYREGAPVSSRPVSALERIARAARRRSLAAATLPVTAAALVALVVVGLGLMLWARMPHRSPAIAPPAARRGPTVPLDFPAWSGAIRRVPLQSVTPADFAAALNDLGQLHRDLGRPAQAEAAFRRSAAILRQLVEAQPEVAAYRRGLSDAYEALAEILRDSGQPAEADTAAEAARALRASLAADPQHSPVPPAGPDPLPEAEGTGSGEADPSARDEPQAPRLTPEARR